MQCNDINMSEEEKKEERKKAVRDKLAGYIYDVSKVVIAGIVVGGISPVFSNGELTASSVAIVICGTVIAVFLAYFAYRIMHNIKQ